MQTLQDFLKITKNICKTLIYIALCICLTVNLSACKSVRIDNQALETSQKELELCNKIYSIAKRKQKIVDSENSGTDNSKSVISSKDASNNKSKNTSKDRSKNSSFGNKSKSKISESIKDSFLKETAKAWQEVAIQCDTKFAEATIKNAQIMLKLSQKSNNSFNNSSNKINDYAKNEEISAIKSIREFTHNNESLRLSHDPLAQAAAGEDRLAFILQTLAAKNLDKKLIKLSDSIASISNIFMHIAGNGEDVRKKTYNMPVDALSSEKTRDYTSTKTLDIAAISYMECAREELLAFNTSMYITAYNSKNEVEESDNSKEESNSKSENKSENKRLNEKDIVHKFKRILMKLVTSRLLRAYSLGYPTDESSSLTYKSSK
ncbi:hypothetical protein HMPREF3230_01303 [Gardnerella vaginalis]|uniref:Uncharacterized protein n=1 Tax=Gardnerella vaginalis TaxID=2702 RepID=A0A135Z269_GARVA|nr:hypothetical protein HMPREF3230_01303 [Gardnerella vaginalis]